ncbi:MAG: hypothetical protein ABI591_23350 [Kofleriaceae bacterium]
MKMKAATDPPVRIKRMDTGNTMDRPESAICPDGMAVTTLDIYAACGDDGLELQCAPTACM